MYQRDTSAAKLQIQNEHIEIDIKLSSELAVINVNGSQDQISSWRGPLNYGQGTHTYARSTPQRHKSKTDGNRKRIPKSNWKNVILLSD